MLFKLICIIGGSVLASILVVVVCARYIMKKGYLDIYDDDDYDEEDIRLLIGM